MKNKNNILYCLNNKYNNLGNIVMTIKKDNIIMNPEVLYESVGDVLHWIGVCLDENVISLSVVTPKDESLILAFKGAVNALKHDIDLVYFDKFINCTRFPFTFDAIFSDKGIFLWNELSGSIGITKKQLTHYNTFLSNKDILETTKQIIIIIRKYLP